MLEKIEAAIERLKAKGATEAEIGAVLRKLIHGPLVALLVSLTPNKADDAALELLKALFPVA